MVQRLLIVHAKIGDLSIPAPTSWQFPTVIETARKISPRNLEGRAFDQSGLAYPLKKLESLPVATMPPGELQNYADIVTHAFPDASFLRSIYFGECDEIPAGELNTLSFANVAYISLQAQVPSIRTEAASCLKELQHVWRWRRER